MATKPVILAVDDDLPVLRAVERDLRARYGEKYRIVAANSGHDALEAVRQLTLRGSVVALFMVDQRMPQMTGIEFLAEAVQLQGDARRVLLTAYADTSPGTRRTRSCTRSSTTSSPIGSQRSGRRSRGCACWRGAGRRAGT
jgi:thioredoxin reductase (NADPH)